MTSQNPTTQGVKVEQCDRWMASEPQAERAIHTLRNAIKAAENGNQNGENFVVAASHGLMLREALRAVVDAVRDYLPPDGIDAQECLNRIIAATDNPEINPVIAEIIDGRA
ncbi:hypothetical protein [Qipengyuania sp. MTN3-11]|uniref:hypothetical protein n=1 Tax=Qipengyuania sp. MTN3-11 TaxID=3056557 RepID=UPI0036F396ED